MCLCLCSSYRRPYMLHDIFHIPWFIPADYREVCDDYFAQHLVLHPERSPGQDCSSAPESVPVDLTDPDILFFRNGMSRESLVEIVLFTHSHAVKCFFILTLTNGPTAIYCVINRYVRLPPCPTLSIYIMWRDAANVGGFVYFDRQDAVVGALALSTQPSRFFFLYHNPEFLDPRDAER